MGVYNRLEEVPDKLRLECHRDEYSGRDVWEEFAIEQREKYTSKLFAEVDARAEREWKAHMVVRGRHHALATPEDVDLWCRALLVKCAVATVHNPYWVRLEAFYSWLQNHVEHPHVYHPVLMAAANYETAETIWEEKFGELDGDDNE